MTLRLVPLVSALVLAVAGAGAGAAQAGPAAQTVKVTAKDFKFVLSTSSVAHGRITFAIKNAGASMHDFVIANHTSNIIGPGQHTSLAVMLKPGRYPYRCSVDSHAALGMKGVLRVK